MKPRRTSLKDLAERLGVSIATVSRALRNSHEVGDEMKQRVQELAKELNYRPNPFARSLRQEAPRVIGVVVPDLVTHYFAGVLNGIEERARKDGYSVISSNSHESYEKEEAAIDNFIDLHVAGIIACLAQNTTDYEHFKSIHKMGIPLVFFARTCLPELFSSVTGNGDIATQEATEHLIAQGCRRIAFVGGPNHLDMVRRRKHGYLEALREHRIPIDREIVSCGFIDGELMQQATERLLQLPDRPDAIIGFNNIATYAAYSTIKRMGLRIPDDVALIGFTDSPACEYVTPTISSIEDMANLQGQKACEMLLKHIGGETKVRKEVVPMVIKIRESSRKN
ncbi:MAG: LacI family DNA-binding transcriptional regulator [Prevotella sp.]|nr:LacI family DNA-binding transcriptional regulator [Prevotella sp.]